MDIREAQERILLFDRARGWENKWNVKDLALNIIEEVGEFWHLIKWIDEDAQRRVIAERKDEAADFIGDTLFLILKLANRMRIDASNALQQTLEDYEKRMPPDVMRKLGHANTHAGGYDQKR